MLPSEPSSGRTEAPTSARSGTGRQPGSRGHADPLSLHEFLSKLLGDSDSRYAFEADPQGYLNRSGLGDVSPTDVLEAASLILDYAPVEVVQEYERSLHPSFRRFAARSDDAHDFTTECCSQACPSR
jgi:hypothetical protein